MEMRSSPVGHLVPISGHDVRFGEDYECLAFVADPLPGEFELSHTAWMIVTEASTALGRLDAAARRLPNPHVIRRPQIIREAQSTSALEGTYVAYTDIVEAEIADIESLTPDHREVWNYIVVAETALGLIGDRPLSVGMLKEMQATLMEGTRSDDEDSGRIRRRQVVVGPKNTRIVDARFVPGPPGDQLEASISAWANWINDDLVQLPPVARVALAHYQLETIHPFSDGNGRIGRLVILLQLMQYEVLGEGLLTISPWFEARRTDYQDELLNVSATGDFGRWISFFSTAIRDQADEAVRKIDRLTDFGESVAATIASESIRGVGRSVAENLIALPVVTVPNVSSRYDVSFQAANKAVARLVASGLLEEVTGRTYGRVFACREAIRIAEA